MHAWHIVGAHQTLVKREERGLELPLPPLFKKQLLPKIPISHFCYWINFLSSFFFKRFVLRERGREGGREGEKHQCVAASHVPPTGDLVRNSGMCPDWDSNQQPCGLQAGTPINWAIPARADFLIFLNMHLINALDWIYISCSYIYQWL